MTTILQQTGLLFPILLFCISILSFLLYLFGFPVWRKQCTERTTVNQKATPPASKRSITELILFFFLMSCSVGLFFALKNSYVTEAVATEGTAAQAAPAAQATLCFRFPRRYFAGSEETLQLAGSALPDD